MSARWLIFLLLIVLSLSGCSTVQKRQNLQVAKLVYAQQSALKSGRIDKVAELNDQLVRILPPPKAPIKINEFKGSIFTKEEIAPEKVYVVLPPELANKDVIVAGDDKYKELLKNNPELKKLEEEADKEIAKLEKTTNEIIRDKEAVVEKNGEKTSWFSWFTKGMGIFSVLGVAGVVVLLILFPAAAPLIANIFMSFVSMINRFIGWVSSKFG